ncbi:MAG: YggT family protein [Syntrophomonadaceae bacterium]|jgi:YggT family protein
MLAHQVINIVNVAFEVLIWLIIIRCLLSFFNHNPYQPAIRFVYDITEPIMAPFRRLIPSAGGIDFSPLLAFFVIKMVQRLIVDLLYTVL